jgi:hypothetical protein
MATYFRKELPSISFMLPTVKRTGSVNSRYVQCKTALRTRLVLELCYVSRIPYCPILYHYRRRVLDDLSGQHVPSPCVIDEEGIPQQATKPCVKDDSMTQYKNVCFLNARVSKNG